MEAKKQVVTMAGSVLTVAYPTIGKKFVTDTAKYVAALQAAALAHGWKQKFGDAASGGTPAEKYEMVQRIHAGLVTGEWELSPVIDHSAIIIEAVSRIKKLTIAQVTKAADKREGAVKEWGANAGVKAMVATIRAERATEAAEASDDDAEDIVI